MAPLMGAEAAVDPGHRKWLHVHVRPPLRGLLKVLRVITPALFLLHSLMNSHSQHIAHR